MRSPRTEHADAVVPLAPATVEAIRSALAVATKVQVPAGTRRPLDQVDFVRHDHRPLQPEVVRAHDLHQLEDLGLIATAPAGRRSMTFWPTLHGRAAVKDAPGYLERVARETDDEREKSRLQQWAKRLRAGDIAVGTIAGSTSGMLIRALMGL